MIREKNDAYHAHRAYVHVKMALDELAQMRHMDNVRALARRELYKIEDALWQMEPRPEGEHHGKQHADI